MRDMPAAQRADLGAGTRFLDALGRRDYDGLAACFADDATLRPIVPPGVREADGPEAIAERFRIWTEDAPDYELVEAEAAPFADLLRLRWAVRSTEAGAKEATMFEQAAYAEVSGGLITAMRLACSGDRPLP